MKLDTRQLELIKQAIKDFNYIKEEITNLINKGKDLQFMLEYLELIDGVEITNAELDNKNFNYVDFYYYNLSVSVVKDSDKPIQFQNGFELYDNDKNEWLIEDYLNIREWENILDKGEI